MTETNPYKAYADESILNSGPVGLVVALYEGAIDASVSARKYLAEGDIPARTKQINKIVNIITELMRSLNDEQGGEIAANLRRVYAYINGKVLEAHLKKNPEPLLEVEKLFGIMLEGWREANKKLSSTPESPEAAVLPSNVVPIRQPEALGEYGYGNFETPYGGGYISGTAELCA